MKLMYYDYLVIASVILLWGAHFITNFLIGYISDASEFAEIAQAVVQVFEANPLAKYVLLTQHLRLIFSTILVPAIIFGSYVWLRRHLNKKDAYGAEHVAWIMFFVAATDFLNDLSITLGLLM